MKGRRKTGLAFMLCVLLAFTLLASCSDPGTTSPPVEEPAQTQPGSDGDAAPQGAPPILDITEVSGFGPSGEPAISSGELSLTEEERQQLRDGNYSVALCMHQTDNAVNYTKMEVMRDYFESIGINVVAITDSNSNVIQMVNDVESVIALEPDVIISSAFDQSGTRTVFEKARDAGIGLVFYEVEPEGFVAGKDYVSLISADYPGAGAFAAEYMAYLMNYEGTVGIAYLETDAWVCKGRDDAFRKVMESYPNIEVVMEAGYADYTLAGTAADAILAKHPDISGIYATWDDPAELVIASALAVGRDDLIVTTCDLGENASRVLAEGGLMRAVGAPRSYEDGMATALSACYYLLGKELPGTFILTPAIGVVQDNVLDAYKACYYSDPPNELIAAWEKSTGKTWSPAA